MNRVTTILFALCAVAFAGKAVSAGEHIVRIVSDYDNLRMAFEPKLLIIKPGDTVTWVNELNEEHNVVSYPDGFPKGEKAFASQMMQKKNEKWSYTFRTKGTYEYHCIPHLPMGMHGQVIVERPSKASEYHKPSRDEINAYRLTLEKYFDDDEFKYKSRASRNHSAQKAAAHQHRK
jgi:plastocyanin